MISEAVMFAAVICVALSFNLNFEEDGGTFTEKILINKTANTVEYDVPQHGQVGASKYLVDHASGYNVMKLDDEERCYVMDIQKGEPKARQVKLALKMLNGTFPTNRYFVEKNNILPMYEMDRSMLSASILAFCGDYPIIKVVSAQSVKEIEKAALQHFQARRVRRQVGPQVSNTTVVVDYPVCDVTQLMDTFKQCGATGEMLIRCRAMHARKCVYKLQCTPSAYGGWQCPGDHVFTIPFCCNPVCADHGNQLA